MNLTIIILAHNEEKTIKKHVEDIKRKIINKIKKTELIIFHDGSRDSTHKILLKLKRKLKFRYIYKKKRIGVHLALHKSLLLSRGKKIFFTDSGNKFKLKDFWKLYKFKNKYDLLSGYRVKRQDQIYRMFLTKFFNIFLRTFTISKFYDIDSGFKIFDKKKLKKILSTKKIKFLGWFTIMKELPLPLCNFTLPTVQIIFLEVPFILIQRLMILFCLFLIFCKKI